MWSASITLSLSDSLFKRPSDRQTWRNFHQLTFLETLLTKSLVRSSSIWKSSIQYYIIVSVWIHFYNWLKWICFLALPSVKVFKDCSILVLETYYPVSFPAVSEQYCLPGSGSVLFCSTSPLTLLSIYLLMIRFTLTAHTWSFPYLSTYWAWFKKIIKIL